MLESLPEKNASNDNDCTHHDELFLSATSIPSNKGRLLASILEKDHDKKGNTSRNYVGDGINISMNTRVENSGRKSRNKKGIDHDNSSSSSNSATETSAYNNNVNDDGNSDNVYNQREYWSKIKVPPERVLLFPGALATSSLTNHNNSISTKDSSSNTDTTITVTGEDEYREIAHCDGCSSRIYGTIQKCTVCFDYDLCLECFPSLSKSHCNGEHRFCAEKGE